MVILDGSIFGVQIRELLIMQPNIGSLCNNGKPYEDTNEGEGKGENKGKGEDELNSQSYCLH